MSFYSCEEICEGCKYAVFHKCCGSFCKCEIGHASDCDIMRGNCEYFEEEEEQCL